MEEMDQVAWQQVWNNESLDSPGISSFWQRPKVRANGRTSCLP